jgi:hypothetical protein
MSSRCYLISIWCLYLFDLILMSWSWKIMVRRTSVRWLYGSFLDDFVWLGSCSLHLWQIKPLSSDIITQTNKICIQNGTKDPMIVNLTWLSNSYHSISNLVIALCHLITRSVATLKIATLRGSIFEKNLNYWDILTTSKKHNFNILSTKNQKNLRWDSPPL